ILETPDLAKGISAADHARQRFSKILGDLQQQWAVEAILKEGTQSAVSIPIVEPNCGFEAELTQTLERFTREEVVYYGDAGSIVDILSLGRRSIPRIRQRPPYAGHRADIYETIIEVANDLILFAADRCARVRATQRHVFDDALVIVDHR